MRRATGIGADAFRSGGEVYLASNLRIKDVRLNVGDARGSSSAVAPGARSTPSSRQRRTTSLAVDADAVLQQHGRRDAYQKRRPARLLPNTPIRAFVVGLIDRPRADRCERLAPRDDDLFCDYGRHHLQQRALVTILNRYMTVLSEPVRRYRGIRHAACADLFKGLGTICNPSGHRPRQSAGDAIRRERN
jgi:hypothetical protein